MQKLISKTDIDFTHGQTMFLNKSKLRKLESKIKCNPTSYIEEKNLKKMMSITAVF